MVEHGMLCSHLMLSYVRNQTKMYLLPTDVAVPFILVTVTSASAGRRSSLQSTKHTTSTPALSLSIVKLVSWNSIVALGERSVIKGVYIAEETDMKYVF